MKIELKNTDVYLGLADVYIEMGDYDKAEEVLEEAKEVITKKEDKERIEWKENKMARSRKEEEDTKVTPTPEQEVEKIRRTKCFFLVLKRQQFILNRIRKYMIQIVLELQQNMQWYRMPMLIGGGFVHLAAKVLVPRE